MSAAGPGMRRHGSGGSRGLSWRGLPVLVAALFVVAIGTPSAIAAEPQVLFRGIPHDMLYDLSFEGQQGVTVGDRGLIVETVDGGATWTRQSIRATEQGLFSVIRKQGKCIAGGQSGLILFSDDCKKWTQAPPVSKARILSVSANSSGVAVAVGGFGAILKSADWGKTWHPVDVAWKDVGNEGAEPHLYDVHVGDDGEVTAVGEFELVLRSRDGGANWSVLHKGKRSLFGLQVLANGEAYAVGQEGVILKSGTRGQGWQELESGTRSILTGVWANSAGRVIVTGIYTILQSDNGGKTWKQDTSRLAKMLSYQAVVGAEKESGSVAAILVGSGGTIVSVGR